MEMEKINLNGVEYVKESDVDRFYTPKDNVVVDLMVLEAALLKHSPDELVRLFSSIAEEKLKNAGYAELQEMIKRYNEEFTLGKLLMIANIGKIK